MRRKSIGLIIGVITVTVVLAMVLGGSSKDATDESAAEKATLFLYDGQDANKHAVFDPEFERFKEANPNIVFEVVQVTGDDVRTRIRVDVASGNPPAVFGYGGFESLLGPLAAEGIVIPVDEYFEKSTETSRSDYPADAFDSMTVFDGKAYGIPSNTYKFFTLANRELFEKYNLEYPETYEDLLAVSKVFSDNGIVPLAVGSKGGNPSHFYFSELYTELEGGLDEINGFKESYQFATENTYRIAEVIDEMRRNNVFPRDTIAGGDWGPSFSLFAEEKAAMIFSFTFVVTALSEEMQQKVDFIDTPVFSDAVLDPADYTHTATVGGIMINTDNWYDMDKQWAIIKYVDWITSVEMMNTMARVDVLPLKNVPGIDLGNLSPIMRRVIEHNENKTVVQTHFTQYPDANAFTLFQNTLDELWAGAIAPRDFVDKVQAGLDEAKARNDS